MINEEKQKNDQKKEPYLVYEYLMRYSDANHVVSANELVGYLQECGISAECRSIYKEIEEINKALLLTQRDGYGIIMTRFNDDNIEAEFVTLDICGFESENGTELEIYLLDATHDLKLIQRSVFYGNKFTWEPKVANYDCYLIKLKRK